MIPQQLNELFVVLSHKERTILYLYTLIPVCAIAFLLFFTSLLRARRIKSLALYSLSIAVWSLLLLVMYFPNFSFLGQRFAAFGTVVAASYVHVTYDFTQQKRYGLVWLVYGVALSLTLLGALRPGALYHPLSLTAGPLFLPAMALAAIAVLIPMSHISLSYETMEEERKSQLWALFASGVLCFLGCWWHVWLLAEGVLLPYGMILVLLSLFLLGHVVTGYQARRDQRLVERSFWYTTIAALLSAGFLLGALSLVTNYFHHIFREYRVSVFFFLFMAALAFEPLRQSLQELLGRMIVPDRTALSTIAMELEKQEEVADQARRLAEIGSFVSAVAHEVRNPLGVLKAHLRLLQRKKVEATTLEAMQDQIDRAEHFINDLLQYGRPRPLEVRRLPVKAMMELAVSTAKDGLHPECKLPSVQTQGASDVLTIEADQSQLLQVLVILLENAMLALQEQEDPQLRLSCETNESSLILSVEDNGPGIPEAIQERVFEPFVTGRKRDIHRSGTGLGLAIARGIVERHRGTIQAARSSMGGALFAVTLPQTQQVLALTATEG